MHRSALAKNSTVLLRGVALACALPLGCSRTALGEDVLLGLGGAGGASSGAIGGPGPSTNGATFGTDGSTDFTSSGGFAATGTTQANSSSASSVTSGGGRASATGAGGLGGFGGLGGLGGAGGTAGASGMAGASGDCSDACDGSWGTPERLETDDGGILGAEIAMNDDGAAVAAWSQGGALLGVSAALYTPEAGWGEAELLGADGVEVDPPRVAIDDGGAASVIWRANEDAPNLRARRYEVGSGWEGTAFVNPDAASAAFTPDVAMNADDTTWAVWLEYDGTHYDLWASRFTPDEGWASAVPVQSESESNPPTLATNASGDTLVVWSQTHEQQHHVWASAFDPNSTWTPPEVIQTVGSDLGQEPDLAIDVDGNALAVWHQYRDGGAHVWANRFTPGAGWGAPEIIETAPQGAYFPRIGMDGVGNAVAAWRQSDGSVYDIWSNRYTRGSGWGSPELISGTAKFCQSPEIAVGSAGDVVAVWTQGDTERGGLWANRFVPGAGWGESELVDGGPGLWLGYDVAIDGEGNAIVVWSHSDGGSFDLWSSTSRRPR